MLTKEEAKKWAQSMCKDGTGKVRKAYLEQFGVGRIAKEFWNDEKFCLGLEYGILIAVAKIYEDLKEIT